MRVNRLILKAIPQLLTVARSLVQVLKSQQDEPVDLEALASLLYGIYGEEVIEKVEQVLEKESPVEKAWRAEDHPRGENGRFIPKGSTEARATAADEVAKAIAGDRSSSPQRLMSHLSLLTVRQIRDLARKHGKRVPSAIKSNLMESLRALVGSAATPIVPYETSRAIVPVEEKKPQAKPQAKPEGGEEAKPESHLPLSRIEKLAETIKGHVAIAQTGKGEPWRRDVAMRTMNLFRKNASKDELREFARNMGVGDHGTRDQIGQRLVAYILGGQGRADEIDAEQKRSNDRYRQQQREDRAEEKTRRTNQERAQKRESKNQAQADKPSTDSSLPDQESVWNLTDEEAREELQANRSKYAGPQGPWHKLIPQPGSAVFNRDMTRRSELMERLGMHLWQKPQKEALSVTGITPEKHRKAVEDAFRTGRRVPSEVLADYPDLAEDIPGDDGGTTVNREVDAKRSGAKRSRQPVHFAMPIVGPSGAKLTSYDWKYMEVEEPHGDDVVTRKVSNWDQAETNEHTGRDVVHHFYVELPNGKRVVASLESALNLMGFGLTGIGSNKVRTLATAAMELAQQRQAHSRMMEGNPSEWEKKKSASKIEQLVKRVDSLTKEAAMAAKGESPIVHYRRLAHKIHALRDLFFKRPGYHGVWSNKQIGDIARLAAPGNPPKQRQIAEEGAEAMRKLAAAGQLNVLGERTAKTPIPNDKVRGVNGKPLGEWSDAKIRNWYLLHGDKIGEAVADAVAWLKKYHPDFNSHIEHQDYDVLKD